MQLAPTVSSATCRSRRYAVLVAALSSMPPTRAPGRASAPTAAKRWRRPDGAGAASTRINTQPLRRPRSAGTRRRPTGPCSSSRRSRADRQPARRQALLLDLALRVCADGARVYIEQAKPHHSQVSGGSSHNAMRAHGHTPEARQLNRRPGRRSSGWRIAAPAAARPPSADSCPWGCATAARAG